MLYRDFKILLLGILFFSCREEFENRFKDYNDIILSKYIEKGWVPKFIPRDCSEIRVINNIDNNHFYGSFSFHSNSFISDSNLFQISIEDIFDNLKQINNPDYPAWFINKKELSRDNKFLFYKAANYYLIIDTSIKKCYYFG
jgi:hypothetical protein